MPEMVKCMNLFAGDGTAESLSYTYYQGYVWILYSNEMNSGYKGLSYGKI